MSLHWPKITLCAFTQEQEVSKALTLSPDAIGFVLAEDAKSPLSPKQLEALCAPLSKTATLTVAVTGAATLGECKQLSGLGIDVLQVVVDDWFEPELLEMTLLPVFFDSEDVLERVHRVLRGHVPGGRSFGDAVCLDGAGGGGRGSPADWSRAKELAARFPLVLAGGLNSDNLAEALASVGPFGVDVSSGIEGPSGGKDPARMAQFVKAARLPRPTLTR